MSLTRMDDLLKEARNNNYAVGAFECWDSPSIYAIAKSAAKCNAAVIFQASPTEYDIMGGPDALSDVVQFYIKKTNITAALHLDHGSTLDHVEECAKAGFTSVMLDASRLPFSENVKLSKEAAQIAQQYNASIEAELGHVAGCEAGFDEMEDSAVHLTDPQEAKIFVQETGIDCLAVAIGTVHGNYRGKPKIDTKRLEEIAAIIKQPLVLHGGSGTPEDILRKCIGLGIAKINICTDIHKIWLDGIAEARKTLTPSVPGKFYQPAHEVFVNSISEKIEIFKNR